MIQDALAEVRNGELWLLNVHIPELKRAGPRQEHEPKRMRKLLAKKNEILKLEQRMLQQNMVKNYNLFFSFTCLPHPANLLLQLNSYIFTNITIRRLQEIVPIQIYYNDKDFIKVELGVGKQKSTIDKREDIMKREGDREIKRVMKSSSRGGWD